MKSKVGNKPKQSVSAEVFGKFNKPKVFELVEIKKTED